MFSETAMKLGVPEMTIPSSKTHHPWKKRPQGCLTIIWYRGRGHTMEKRGQSDSPHLPRLEPSEGNCHLFCLPQLSPLCWSLHKTSSTATSSCHQGVMMLGPPCPPTGTLTPALTTVSSPWEPRTGSNEAPSSAVRRHQRREADGEWLLGYRKNNRD